MKHSLRILFALILLLGIRVCSTAQNLVPNPSFEDLRQRPCRFLTYPARDTVSQNISSFVKEWRSPTGGTADPWLFSDTVSSECTQNLKEIGVAARTGKSCVGLFTGLNTKRSPSRNLPYREYIQTRLREPLRKGAVYYVEFYVHRLPNSGTVTNNLGAYFSTQAVGLRDADWRNYGTVLPYTPQINETKVVQATLTWQKIAGCFVAEEAYEYLTLGNFFSDSQTLLETAAQPSKDDYPYYLFDDIYVGEAGTRQLPVALGRTTDTTLCPGQAWTLQLSNEFSYQWQDGSTGANYTFQKSGTYWITARAGRCLSTDTVRVTVELPVVLPADTVLCQGETLLLTPLPSSRRYTWNDGSSGPSLAVTTEGTYVAEVPSRYCALKDTVQVRVVACPGSIPNVFTPNGDRRNDVFFVENVDAIPWQLDVYNRWGSLVYRSYPYKNEWTGEELSAGVYYYQLSSQDLKRTLKGWVELLR